MHNIQVRPMILTHINKTLPLLILTCNILVAQEKLFSAADTIKIKFENEYKEQVNRKLLTFAHSLGKNPELVLNMVATFYSQTCQAPENCTWLAYLQLPVLNLQKTLAYFNLSRKVNKHVYAPYVETIIEKLNTPIDSTLATPGEVQDMRTAQEENLATLADHPVLNEQASLLFAQEWPYYSVRFDLEAHKSILEKLKESFETHKQQLALMEQNDINLETFNIRLEQKINALNHAIQIITYKEAIKTIIKNPLAFIMHHIKNNCLLEELEKYKVAFPLTYINDFFKSHNPDSNSLLHEICTNLELSDQQKIKAIRLFEENGIHINEHNKDGKTPLDLLKKDTDHKIRQILIDLGGQHSLPKVISLKKSYDTPPASPQPKQVTFESK